MNEKEQYVRYGFCDLILPASVEPPKYIGIFDKDGNKIGEVEAYFVCYEDKK